jgi:outer membrane receptor protein involved in Fe transport
MGAASRHQLRNLPRAFQKVIALAAVVAASASPVVASVFGDVRGLVLDPQQKPIAGSHVTLQASPSSAPRTVQTDARGEFLFRALPLGEYVLSVESAGFAKTARALTVVSDSVPLLRLALAIAPLSESTEVVAASSIVGSDSPTPESLVDRQQIEETPGADRANSLAMLVNVTPGAYMTHDQLHVRGGHQISWLVDGVPVPNTNIASNVGPQFDPKDIDFLEVQRGAYSAEFGDRTYGVLNVVPRTGFDYDHEAELVASYGSFDQTNDQLRLASHSERFGYYVSVGGNRSDFGLATPSASVLHDEARGLSGFASLIYKPSDHDEFRLAASGRGDRYEVPNDAEAQEAGIADIEQERDAFANLSWVHTTGNSLLTVSPFYHFNRSDYQGAGGVDRTIPTDKHDSHYAGGQLVWSQLTARHRWKAGFYGFYQHDRSSLGLSSADESVPNLEQAQALGGNLEAVFLEDQWNPVERLTLTGGVRYTHFGGSVTENDWSPRLGASFRIPGVQWLARGFWGHYYQAPPLQTVSGPILDLALQEGFGFLPLHGEQDQEYQAGLAIPIQAWAFDLNYFHNAARNYFDHDALDDSNIFFPLTIDRARIRGLELMLKSPRLLGRAQLSVAYSYQHAEGAGAVSGGLTDFSPPEEGYFFLDHDQRHTLNVGFNVQLPAASYLAGAVHYGSGFVDGEGPAHLPGHTLVDLSIGKTFGKSWSLAVHALNVADARFLLDNSETFGGTHYVDPRQVYVRVAYRVRY